MYFTQRLVLAPVHPSCLWLRVEMVTNSLRLHNVNHLYLTCIFCPTPGGIFRDTVSSIATKHLRPRSGIAHSLEFMGLVTGYCQKLYENLTDENRLCLWCETRLRRSAWYVVEVLKGWIGLNGFSDIPKLKHIYSYDVYCESEIGCGSINP